MGWAKQYIEKLLDGETVKFRPKGNSMTGKIESGQLCTVIPARVDEVKEGDIVLCQVGPHGGGDYLHLVLDKRQGTDGFEAQIGNNKGRINGWTTKVYGRCTRVEL